MSTKAAATEYLVSRTHRFAHAKVALSAAVPLWTMRMTPETAFSKPDLTRLSDAFERHGEALVVGGPGAAEGFNALAETIARLSFCPGGVSTFGIRWLAVLKHKPDGTPYWWADQSPDSSVGLGDLPSKLGGLFAGQEPTQ